MEKSPLKTEREDVRRTVKLQLIEEHYESLGDQLHWTVDRYRRLCGALAITEHELGAYMRARITDVERWIRAGKFPPYVELHLTFIEQATISRATKPIFPPL